MRISLMAALSSMRLPSRVAFTVGSMQVYWYGLLLAMGILCVILLGGYESRRLHLGKDTIVDLSLITIPAGIIGARLFYVLMFPEAFSDRPISVLYLWDGGLSILGAVLFAVLGAAVYIFIKKISLARLLDAVAPGLLLSQAVCLWGDFFNQQGYGQEVVSASLQWFPFAVFIQKTGTICLAVFFYEFLWCLAGFLFIWFWVRKKARTDGTVFLTCGMLYCFGHAFFTWMRTDSVYLYGQLKTMSVVCGVLFFLCLLPFLLSLKRAKISSASMKNPAPQNPDTCSCSQSDENPDKEQDACIENSDLNFKQTEKESAVNAPENKLEDKINA